MSVLEALARRGTGVCWGFAPEYEAAVTAAGMRYIAVQSPASAGFAADASAQLSGGLGLVVAPGDLGVLMMIPGMAHALLARAPVIGLRPTVLDLQPLLKASAKQVVRLSGENPDGDAAGAVWMARSPRPGPVWVEADPALASGGVGPDEPAPVPVSVPDSVVASVRSWKKPAILVGFAGRRAPIDDLAARLRAPVLTTCKAKGVLPEQEGWSAGAVGTAASDALHRAYLQECDGILLVGWDPAELPDGWGPGWPAGADIVALDEVLPNRLLGHLREVVGPIATLVSQLADALDDVASTWTPEDVAGHRARWGLLFDETSFGPASIAHAIRAAVGGGDVCTLDGFGGAFSQVWRCDRPDRLLTGHARLPAGYGVPAALAAAAHGRRVVCVTTGQYPLEMATAVTEELSVVVVTLGAEDGVGSADELTGAISEALLVGGSQRIRIRVP